MRLEAKKYVFDIQRAADRTVNPQIKSSLPQAETLNRLNDFSRQLCRTSQITAMRLLNGSLLWKISQ
jgi:hypothetical protein